MSDVLITGGAQDWTTFSLPAALVATRPPEARGVARDGVRLLVAGTAGVSHARFRELPRFLRAGDLVVVNDSATLPAAVDGTRDDGRPVTVHFSTPLPDGDWLVELRRDGERVRDGRAGESVAVPAGTAVHLRQAWPDAALRVGSRLWRSHVDVAGDVVAYLHRHGRPITYGRTRPAPLDAYQTMFARRPGSAEMPSAGRPFSPAVVDGLRSSGIAIATVTLHSGVSSIEDGEPPLPERYRVPAATAAAVRRTREAGGRVVAVGTTVTRALESATDVAGRIGARSGWTELVIGRYRPPRVVDALVTGWHEPRSSHLALVEAVAGRSVAAVAYGAALDAGYRWHEFGDSCLLLP